MATSAYYQLKLEGHVISMYAKDLSDLLLEDVLEAYKKYRQYPKNTRFPLPSQIRNILNQNINDEDKARDATGRIITAISKYGYSNPIEAKEYIGNLGWKVVERQGGWSTLCERVQNDQIPIYQAQWIKYATSLINYEKHETKENGELIKLNFSQNNLNKAIE